MILLDKRILHEHLELPINNNRFLPSELDIQEYSLMLKPQNNCVYSTLQNFKQNILFVCDVGFDKSKFISASYILHKMD